MVYHFKKGVKVYILIKYLRKFNTLVMYWPRDPDSVETGKACCNIVIEVARKYNPRYLINDNRDQAGEWPDMGQWLLENWIPSLHSSGIRHYAQVLSPSLMGKISAKSLFNHPHSGIDFRTFNSSANAIKWLQEIDKNKIEYKHDSTLFDGFSVSQTVVQELNEVYSNLNMVTELANIGLWTQDMYTNEVVANDEMLRMYKISRTELNNDPFLWRTKMDPYDRSVYDSLVKKVIKTRKPEKDFVFKIFPEQGQVKYLKGMIAPLLDYKNNEVVKLTGLNIDISEYLEKEQVLRKTIDDKNKLFRELHHRIKNNLNMIVNLMSMKAMMENNEKLNEFIDDTKSRIFSIAKTHDMLLRFEERDQLSSAKYFEDLINNLVVTSTVSADLYARNLNVENHRIHIDKILAIGLIINEVVSNIIKHAYNPETGGDIDVEFFRKVQFFKLMISDKGVGFKTEKSDSFGIKLIRLFVEQLKGNIRIDSTNGTSYYIEIPVN